MSFCEIHNFKKLQEIDKPGFSSTPWVTTAMLSLVLEQVTRVLFFASLKCSYSPNFNTSFTIAGREGALRRPKNYLVLRVYNHLVFTIFVMDLNNFNAMLKHI